MKDQIMISTQDFNWLIVLLTSILKREPKLDEVGSILKLIGSFGDTEDTEVDDGTLLDGQRCDGVSYLDNS